MRRCRFVMPVTLFDGSHPEDRHFLDFKFLIREERLEQLPKEKSSLTVNLAGEGDKQHDLDCIVADVTYIEDDDVTQILLHHKQLHINWWRCGVKAMFERGWQWAELKIVPPPQKPSY